jgi:alpha-tubulin suppressor-like RCC1 family protein
LTSDGEVYIFGDNTYGQHGIEDLKGNPCGLNPEGQPVYYPHNKFSKINFHFSQ